MRQLCIAFIASPLTMASSSVSQVPTDYQISFTRHGSTRQTHNLAIAASDLKWCYHAFKVSAQMMLPLTWNIDLGGGRERYPVLRVWRLLPLGHSSVEWEFKLKEKHWPLKPFILIKQPVRSKRRIVRVLVFLTPLEIFLSSLFFGFSTCIHQKSFIFISVAVVLIVPTATTITTTK